MQVSRICLKYRCKASMIIIILFTFLFSNLFLLYFLFESGQRKEIKELLTWHPDIITLLKQNFELIDHEWRFSSDNLILKSSNDINCTIFQRLREKEFVATGWTKATYRLVIGDTSIAMKNVNLNGHDMVNCVNQERNSFHECYAKAAMKLLQEIIRLKVIQHPNVIKLIGYCIPEEPDVNDGKGISIMTELGEPLDVIKLLQMTWPERLKMSLEIAKLIHHLTNTPLGPVALNDFRRQQFIFVRGELKLVDIDDISTKDPACDSDFCCIGSLHNKSSNCVICEHNLCEGYNEKLNILNAGKHFIKHILPYGVPSEHTLLVNTISNAYETGSWNASKIFQETKHLSGFYT